jgi:hypothetical protein
MGKIPIEGGQNGVPTLVPYNDPNDLPADSDKHMEEPKGNEKKTREKRTIPC